MNKDAYKPEPIDVERGALVRVVTGPYDGQLGTFVEVRPDGMSAVELPGKKMVQGKLVPFTSTVTVRKVDPSPLIIVDAEGETLDP